MAGIANGLLTNATGRTISSAKCDPAVTLIERCSGADKLVYGGAVGRGLIALVAIIGITGPANASPFAGTTLVGAFKVSIVTCRDGSCAPPTELGMRFNYFVAKNMTIEDRGVGRPGAAFQPGIPKVESSASRQWDFTENRLVQTIKVAGDGFRIIFTPAEHGKCAIAFEPLPQEGSVDHSRVISSDCRMARAAAAEH